MADYQGIQSLDPDQTYLRKPDTYFDVMKGIKSRIFKDSVMEPGFIESVAAPEGSPIDYSNISSVAGGRLREAIVDPMKRFGGAIHKGMTGKPLTIGDQLALIEGMIDTTVGGLFQHGVLKGGIDLNDLYSFPAFHGSSQRIQDGVSKSISSDITNKLKNLKKREKKVINGHQVERWSYPDNDFGVNVTRYGSTKRMVFPDEDSLTDFITGEITGLTFHNPVSIGEVPIRKTAKYRGQDEGWYERITGEEVLTEPMVGYHYASDPTDAFKAKETSFYIYPKKRYTPENSFRVVVPVGEKVTFYDDEFRVDLDSGMKMERLKTGWNPYTKDFREMKDKNPFIGHRDRHTDI